MQELWTKIQDSLKKRLPGNIYNEWFKPLGIHSIQSDEIILSAPTEIHIQWVVDNYLDTLKELICELTSKKYELSFRIGNMPLMESHAPTEPPFSLNKQLNFDNFVVGSCNQLAHAAALAVANNPGHVYNPLFIFGGVGLGKTHLLNAIGNMILKNFSYEHVILLSSETFVNEFINATAHGKMNEFRLKYRSRSNLLLDDIQFFSGKERTQEEFFYTFNILIDAKKQIVLTGDKYPKDIPRLEERLRSRFESGLIVDIQQPDIETKSAILKKKAEQEGIELPDDVAFYIASLDNSNIRDLYGYLIRVKAYASLKNKLITLDIAKEALQNLVPEKKMTIGIDDILRVVADYFKIKVSDLKSPRRMRSIAFPRQIAMFIARNKLGCSFPELGEKFGGKDHSTIIYGVNKIEERINKDDNLKSLINSINKKIEGK